jgi:hypothetical protein
MRFTSNAIALAVLLVSGAAGADGGNAKDPGKGASGPVGPVSEGPSGGSSYGPSDTSDRPDIPSSKDKSWEVGAGLEYHHLIASGDLNGDVNRNVDYWSLFGRWDVTPDDRLTLTFGVYQRFLADAGESGARLDDLLLQYTHRFVLPQQFSLRLYASITAPTSYGSQLAGLYTVPSLGVEGDKKFGKYFSLNARVRGSVDIVKSAEGGAAFNGGGNSGFGLGDNGGGADPNPKGSLSLRLLADLAMPFHTPLSISALVYTSYAWFYNVGGGAIPGGDGGQSAFGMSNANNPSVMSTGQPTNQFYGWEIGARYDFPAFAGIKTDLSFAFAPLGDPTLGWTPVVQSDGARAVMGYYRQNAEFYFSLNARY